ncbi:hypothetical protein BHE74_00058362 [Ensete ventricosum]|nr:hypothetical protein BHE74_00058362 [Ensete ventricosum]
MFFQVEKAFREGTARQNAHCTFVCLALELLEERLHVACKEIITLEKQTKLLEEEEKEKRKEEERKERRRTKEREKKLRRKERLKEKGRERKLIESKSLSAALPESKNKSSPSIYEESIIIPDSADFVSVTGDISLLEFPVSPDVTDEHSSGRSINIKTDDSLQLQSDVDGKLYTKSGLHRFYISNERRDQQDEADISTTCSRGINGLHWPSRERVQERFDFQCCSCNKMDADNEKNGYHISTIRSGREMKTASRIEHELDMPRSSSRNVRYNNGCYFSDNFVVPKGKYVGDTPGKEIFHTKQVWEPLDTQKKISKSNSDSKITFRCISKVESSKEICFDKGENGCQQSNQFESVGNMCSSEHSTSSEKTEYCSNKGIEKNLSPIKINCSYTVRRSSSSDNCFSCISEGDSSTSSSSLQNAESSLSSDSEDACQQSCARDASVCNNDSFHEYLDQFSDKKIVTNRGRSKNVQDSNNGQFGFVVPPPPNCMLPMQNHSIHVPVISSPMIGYHTQHISSWVASPCNGFMPYPQANHYLAPSLGYGLPTNRLSDLSMHYNIVQPLNVPVFDARKEFLYQTGSQRFLERSFSDRHLPSKQSAEQNGSAECCTKSQNGSSSFSLFHFGGPMAGTNDEFIRKLPSLEDETTGGFVSNLTTTHAQPCSKEEIKVEEYCLFSSRNSTRFSFF